MKIPLSAVKQKQPNWFSRGNKRFFGDLAYKTMTGRSGKTYLVRSTYAWSDMFDGVKELQYRINEIDQTTYEIGHLTDTIYTDMDSLKEWLRTEG